MENELYKSKSQQGVANPLQSSRAQLCVRLPCILALERVLSETRLLWSASSHSMGTGSDLTDPTGSRHVNRPFCMGKRENGPPNRCQILTPICRRGRGGPPRPRRTPQIATDPPHTPYRPVRPGERAGGGDEGSRGSTTTPGVLARGSFIIIIRDRLFPNSLVVQLSSLISRSFICGADSFRSRRRGAHAGVGAGRCRARGRRRVGTAD
jgi:hypothetical protein